MDDAEDRISSGLNRWRGPDIYNVNLLPLYVTTRTYK